MATPGETLSALEFRGLETMEGDLFDLAGSECPVSGGSFNFWNVEIGQLWGHAEPPTMSLACHCFPYRRASGSPVGLSGLVAFFSHPHCRAH
jgi:hypothetical protein